MKKLSLLVLFAAVATLVASCGGGKGVSGSGKGTPEIEYNPLVEGFTSGAISRRGTVEVTFTNALPAEIAESADGLSKHIKISPKVKGTWSVAPEDGRTVIFRPDEELKRETGYEIEIALPKLFPDNPEAENFTFSFQTLPAVASAELTGFICEPDGTYEIQGVMHTADFEDSTQVVRMAQWSETGKGVKWFHSGDGKKHTFSVSGLKPDGKDRDLTLTVKDSKAGYKEQPVGSFLIPDGKSFRVHSVEYFADQEKYVEVRFTKPLDGEQDLRGLVRLEGLSSATQADGNVVSLYPNDTPEDDTQLIVDASVRSSDGLQLEHDEVFSVQMGGSEPAVRFVGKGTIVPPTSAMVSHEGRGIPFQAVNLRAVQVDVYRIAERSVGQFLQENDLGDQSTGNLMRTARPVASKTIFLDQQGDQNLRRWTTYSLDLDELIRPEQGAIYTIVLSYKRSMAALPCIEQSERLTPEAAVTADEQRIKDRNRQFDRGGYYYSAEQYDWSDYNWREREDPCKSSFYYDRSVTRTLLTTDLGVIAKASDRPEMLFMVHSIATTEPVAEAKIELRNFQDLPVGSGYTDASGQATVSYQNGRPYYAVVSKGDQRTYIKVNAGNELSTSTFDVSGEQVQEGMRGFIWTERGVWRPGDTIYMNFVTAGVDLPKGHPVTVELRSPLGQLYQKRVATQSVGGIYSFVLTTEPESPTGVWNAKLTVGGATFNKRLRIESVKPNRLKINLTFPDKMIQRGAPLGAQLHGEWLTGARAGNLKYTLETEFTATKSAFAGYEKYVFDNPYKIFRPETATEINGTTDAEGNATVNAVISGGEQAGGMLQAHILTRLFEPSGEASIDATTVLYSPFKNYVGIKAPEGADRQLNTDQSYNFELASVTPDGKAAGNRSIEVNAYKVNWYWWWDSYRSDLAQYVSTRSLRPFESWSVTTDGSGKGKFSLEASRSQWGTYYVTARDVASGHQSAVLVYMDWPDYGNRQMEGDGATRLAVSLNKQSYQVGDSVTVQFPATAGSRAIISVENGSQVLKVMPVECTAIAEGTGMQSHTFTVTADMQPNVYLNVTLLQPYGSVENDLPVRLYGIVPVPVSSSESHLEPVVTAPDEILPESEVTITVAEKKGAPMAYSLVLVDEGLLDLTRFRTPDPWGAFNARVALGISTWDIYNQVLGAYGGKIEQLFAIGGDDALDGGQKASVNRFPPVVKYLGTFTLDKGKSRTHKVKMPAYLGRVRIMAVAVSQTADGGNGAWGSAEKSVLVRAPLMMLGTAPRSVAPGDEVIVPVTLIATQDNIGSVQVKIEANDVFTMLGSAGQSASLQKTEDKMVYFRLKVKQNASQVDAGNIRLTATASGGKSATYSMDIPVRNLTTPVLQGNSYTVDAGKNWEGNVPQLGIPGTRRVMLEVSAIQPINSAQRMEFLQTYPYGCIEQITSGAFPFLYLADLTALTPKELSNVQSKVRMVLNRYKEYATPDGSMGYWPGSGSPSDWGSVYAFHFMTVAGNKGYDLPAGVYDRLKSVIRSTAARWDASSNPDYNLHQAYQLYVLALAGEPDLAAMNRLRQSGKMSTDGRYMLAAAYGAAGRTDVGRTLLASSEARVSSEVERAERYLMYGSTERSQSIRLLSESILGRNAEAADLAGIVSRALSSNNWMSTQTTAWSMLSLGEYVARSGVTSGLDFDWSVGNESGKVNTMDKKTVIWNQTFENPASGKATVNNKTQGRLYIRTVGSWMAVGDSVQAAADGLDVKVRYLNASGQVIDVSQLERGTDFIAEVWVMNTSSESVYDLMLTQPVPSGWEILPSISGSEDGNMALPRGVTYQDIRDDRVDTYMPRLSPSASVTIRVRLNASYGGDYTLPAIRCQAMYDNKVTGNTASGRVKVSN